MTNFSLGQEQAIINLRKDVAFAGVYVLYTAVLMAFGYMAY